MKAFSDDWTAYNIIASIEDIQTPEPKITEAILHAEYYEEYGDFKVPQNIEEFILNDIWMVDEVPPHVTLSATKEDSVLYFQHRSDSQILSFLPQDLDTLISVIYQISYYDTEQELIYSGNSGLLEILRGGDFYDGISFEEARELAGEFKANEDHTPTDIFEGGFWKDDDWESMIEDEPLWSMIPAFASKMEAGLAVFSVAFAALTAM